MTQSIELAGVKTCVPRITIAIEKQRARAKAAGIGTIKSGCTVNSAGYVPCDPELLRQNTENELHRLGLYPASKKLSMDVYAMARNIYSETGSNASAAEKIAIGEALVNRAQVYGKTMWSLLTRDGKWFADQSGQNPAVASRFDPEWVDLYIAEQVLSGKTRGLIRGATHYYDPGTQDALYRQGKAGITKDAAGVYNAWSSGGDLLTWIGYVPGIDIRRQFFFRKLPVTAEGKAQNAAMREPGRAAVSSSTPPEYLMVCTVAQDPPRWLIALGGVALGTLGLLLYRRRQRA